MTETLHTVVVSQAEMMRYHDPVRVQGYCQSCEKYGAYWSCPPFEAQPLSQLPAWTHAVLMAQKTPVDAGSTPADLVRQFLVARERLGQAMMQRETDGAVAVIAGHCFGCSACTRAKGVDCCAPSRMRYSLEALGFDVTGLTEGLAGQVVPWSAHGVPDHLMIVGALLCPRLDLAIKLAGSGVSQPAP